MGQAGRIGVMVVGTVVGAYFGQPQLGFMLGSAIGMAAFKSKAASITGPIQDTPDYETGGGIDTTLVAADIPIPICFGTTKLSGNIIKAFKLGANNERLLAAVALGEYTGTPDPVLTNLWVNDIQFSSLENFSGSRNDASSWFEFYPDGSGTTVNIENNGEKPIGEKLEQEESHVSYEIPMLGGGDINFVVNHYSPGQGTAQNWSLDYRIGTDGAWINLGNYNQTFQKKVTSESPSGCGGSSTKTENVEGWSRTTHEFTGIPKGNLYFRMTLASTTNGGYILWENIIISNDSGRDVDFKYPYTSFILVNLVRSRAVSSASFKAFVDWPRSNPADAIKFLLGDADLGLGMEKEFNDASFTETASWCAARGRSIGMAVSGASYDLAIGQILTAAGLMLIRTAGYFKLIADDADDPVDQIDSNIDILPGSFSFGLIDAQEDNNRLIVKYIDDKDYDTTQSILVEDSQKVIADGFVREQTIDLTCINSQSSAQQMAEQIEKKQKLEILWIKFAVGIKKSRFEPGNIVTFIHEPFNWSAETDKRFRIISMDEIEDENGLYGFDIKALLHDPTAYIQTYNWYEWVTSDWSLSTDGSSQETGFALVSAIKPVYYSNDPWVALQISVDPPNTTEVNYLELWVRPEFSNTWINTNKTSYNGADIHWIPSESWIIWHFALVVVTGSGSNQDPAMVPSEAFYVINENPPGYGGGRFGLQPYGL
ncbi:MAG: hypothetical protein GY710_17255 [Desulfobacteraceae bacterium]|nr:hypothetical protein [Desulfobacteraceae bacterium]